MSRLTSTLLPQFALLTLVMAQYQSPGSWVMNASIPSTNINSSGCVILAQLTLTSFIPILQAMAPVCPASNGQVSPSVTVHWPIAKNPNDGEGTSSSLAIYGNVLSQGGQSGPYDSEASCVMEIKTQQVQYLLGRSSTWDNTLQELYDDTAQGYVMNGTTGPALAW